MSDTTFVKFKYKVSKNGKFWDATVPRAYLGQSILAVVDRFENGEVVTFEFDPKDLEYVD